MPNFPWKTWQAVISVNIAFFPYFFGKKPKQLTFTTSNLLMLALILRKKLRFQCIPLRIFAISWLLYQETCI